MNYSVNNQFIKKLLDRIIYRQPKRVDTFLVSFPKCGRTWIRTMIGRAFISNFHLNINDEEVMELEELAKKHPGIPKIKVKHDDNPFWKKPEELELSKVKYKHAKVIFLVRDPRDVVVSSYFEKNKRRKPLFSEGGNNEREKAYEGELGDYIHEKIGSFDTILKYYNIWAENHHIPKKLLLVRYEDVQANPNLELRKILNFVDLEEISSEIIAQAVNFASFDRMRQIEAKGNIGSYRLKAGDKNDPESYKTRKGKVGGFNDYLNEQDIAYLNQKMSEIVSSWFGYQP